MPHVYVIVSCIYGSYTRRYLLMRKQGLMVMLLLDASTTVTQELYLDEKTMPHVYVIVSRIYGSYTRTYLLMRKQCLMFMLLLVASTAVTQGVIS